MTERTREQLIGLGEAVRDETAARANTAGRVGGLLVDLAESMAMIDHTHDAVSEEADGFATPAHLAIIGGAITELVEGANVTITEGEPAADGGRSLTIAAGESGGGVPIDVQTFTTDGTWTMPTGGQTVAEITVIGGGGGGAGGNFNAGSGAGGGGGGGSGMIVTRVIPLSILSATESVVIGAGGAGGAAGSSGSLGGASYFRSAGFLRASYGVNGTRAASAPNCGSGGRGSSGGGSSGGPGSAGAAGVGDRSNGDTGVSTSGTFNGGGGGGVSQMTPLVGGGHAVGAGSAFGGGDGGEGTGSASGTSAGGGGAGLGYGAGGGGGGGGAASSVTTLGGGGGGGAGYPEFGTPASPAVAGAAGNTSTGGAGGDGAPGIVIVICY